VSVASASRVINGIKTNPETLARVTAAAEAVGYVPNAAARSLRSRRTGQIAFAMPDVANPVYPAMVGAIQKVARANGSRLILHSTDGDVGDELGFLADLKQRYVDGLILVTLQFTDAHAKAIADATVPVAVIGNPTNGAFGISTAPGGAALLS
jgi:LacI family transcriptional regulator